MNDTKWRTRIHVFHYLARDVYGAPILNKLAVRRALIHKKIQFAEITTDLVVINDELHVKL